MVKFVTIEKFSDETGLTVNSIRSMIYSGKMREGHDFVKLSSEKRGRILIHVDAFTRLMNKCQKENSQSPQSTKESELRPLQA